MQVEGDWGQLQSTGVRGSKAWVTNPPDGDSFGKLKVIPSDVAEGHLLATKGVIPPEDGLTWY